VGKLQRERERERKRDTNREVSGVLRLEAVDMRKLEFGISYD
jgi:hypothetical protein